MKNQLFAGLLTVLLFASVSHETLAAPRPVWDGRALLDRTRFDQDFERLVLKFKAGTGVRSRAGRLVIDAVEGPPAGSSAHRALAAELAAIEGQLAALGLAARPLFNRSESQLNLRRQQIRASSGVQPVDLSLYVAVPLPNLGRGLPLSALTATLVGFAALEVAYPETLDVVHWAARGNNALAPPGITPLFVNLQGYLKPAPVGIDAFYAWTVAGGTGNGVKVYDVDVGANANHEDLPALFATEAGGNNKPHGTAVLGIIAARNNGIGLKGVAYHASVGMKLSTVQNTADTLEAAASALVAGDVLLLETAKELKGWDCDCNPTQAGSVPQEYFSAQFDVLQTATLAGVTVVEVAGNGCVDLDDASFDGWFDRAVQDSGAILVGAGMSTERTPVCYSSSGSRIDVHAWGENIACLGFVRDTEVAIFDKGTNRLYGPNFGGTSGAAAIIAGAVASLQGASKAWFFTPRTPAEVRELLSENATPQTGELNRPIGGMPDLRAALEEMLGL